MKSLGTKSFFIIIFFCVSVVVFFTNTLISVTWLQKFTQEVLFTMGISSMLFSMIINGFLSLSNPSDYYICLYKEGMGHLHDTELFRLGQYVLAIGRYGGRRFEIPRFFIRPLLFLSVFLLSPLFINNQGHKLVMDFPEAIKPSENQFCPEELEIKEGSEKQGCDLIYRAQKMGLVKDLGNCAPDEEMLNLSVCMKRRKGEPVLHYSYRKLIDAKTNFVAEMDKLGVREQLNKWGHQMREVKSLATKQLNSLQNAPRSSHHIFTNVTYPLGPLDRFWAYASGNNCLTKFTRMNPVLALEKGDRRAQSKIVEHSFGHMLFNTKHTPNVGYCREYTIHWGADINTCALMAKNPQIVLKKYGIKTEVMALIKRFEVRRKIYDLKKKLGMQIIEKKDDKDKEVNKSPQLRDSLSFNCLFYNQEKDEQEFHNIQVSRFKMKAHTSHFEADFSNEYLTDRFHSLYLRQMAKSLLPEFNYGPWRGLAKPDVDSATDLTQERLSKEGEFPLVRLEYLKNADIILRYDWIRKRDDLLELYPWYLHLNRFVDLFREEYSKRPRRL